LTLMERRHASVTLLVLLGGACCAVGGALIGTVDFRLVLGVVALWLGNLCYEALPRSRGRS